jgi:ribonuclease J
MLAAAGDVAVQSGVPRDRVCLLDNGDRLTVSEAAVRVEPSAVPAGKVYFDARPELIEPDVVRDRRQIAEAGLVVVFVSGSLNGEIAVVSRGVAGDEEKIADEIRRAARGVLARASPEERADVDWLRAEVALAAKRACRRSFDLRPVIVPVVV